MEKSRYSVRRSDQKPSKTVFMFTTMVTPRKIDALKTAANSAIVNPGFYYYVYKDEIGRAHV